MSSSMGRVNMPIRYTELSAAEVRRQLDELEQRYGLPTERRTEAMDADAACEHDDLDRWDFLARAWARLQGRGPE